MKKQTGIHSLFVILTIGAAVMCASCSNLFGWLGRSDGGSSSSGGDLSVTMTLSDMPCTAQTGADSASACPRAAFPSSVGSLYFAASLGADDTLRFCKAAVQASSNTCTFVFSYDGLAYNAENTFTVYGFASQTDADSVITDAASSADTAASHAAANDVLYASSALTITTERAYTADVLLAVVSNHCTTSGTYGSISLPVAADTRTAANGGTGITKIVATLKDSSGTDVTTYLSGTSGEYSFTGGKSGDTVTITSTSGNLPAGVYTLGIVYYVGTTPVFAYPVQTVTVWPCCATDKWYLASETAGTLTEVTADMLYKTYYVRGSAIDSNGDGTEDNWYDAPATTAAFSSAGISSIPAGSDSAAGSLLAPFKSVQTAVNRITAQNDGSSTYTIYVDGNVLYASGMSTGTNGLVDIIATNTLKLQITGLDGNADHAILNAGGSGVLGKRVMYMSGSSVTVTLQNVTLTGGYSSTGPDDTGNGAGGGIYMAGGTLNLESGARIGYTGGTAVATMENCANHSTFDGGGIYMISAAVVNMYGDSSISYNSTGRTPSISSGGGVRMDTGCTLNMYGGQISYNYATGYGGAVYTGSGHFNMLADKNTVPEIYKNKAGNYGGAVFVQGDFCMETGNIHENSAANGGGIVEWSTSTFTMSDGSIYSNMSTGSDAVGSGIYMKENGKLIMTGGSVHDNASASSAGSGIYIASDCSFYSDAAGTAAMAGNNSSLDNVYGNKTGAVFSDDSVSTYTGMQDVCDMKDSFVRISSPDSAPANNTASINNAITSISSFTSGGGLYLGKTADTGIQTWNLVQSGTTGSAVTIGTSDTAYTKAVTIAGLASDSSHYPVLKAGASSTDTYRVLYCNSSSTVTLTDITIAGGCASDSGSGVYVAGGTFAMSGSAVVTPTGTGANDVYLASGTYITIADGYTLPSGSTCGAVITSAAGNSSAGTKVLAPETGKTLSYAQCNMFALTPVTAETSLTTPGISDMYCIAPDSSGNGVIAKVGVTVSYVPVKYCLSTSSAVVQQGGTSNAVSLVIKDSAGMTVADSTSVTSAVTLGGSSLTLYQNGSSLAAVSGCSATVTSSSVPSMTLPSWLPAGSYDIYMKAEVDGHVYAGSTKLYIAVATAPADFAAKVAAGEKYILLTEDITLTSTLSLVSGTELIAGGSHTVTAPSDAYTFTAASGSDVTFRDITLGAAKGGINIQTGGSVTLDSGTTVTTNGLSTPVSVSGTLTMNSGAKITGNTNTASGKVGGGICVNSGGVFNMTGGEISNNNAYDSSADCYGGGVRIESGGTMNMSGGTISGNNGGMDGGGICSYGTLNMSGGAITNNSGAYTGGGVAIKGGTFAFSGGIINKNHSIYYGGGVYIYSGTMTMTGGTITENSSNGANSSYNYGGGIDLYGGRFDGTDAVNASITNNTRSNDTFTGQTSQDVMYTASSATFTKGTVTIGTVTAR